MKNLKIKLDSDITYYGVSYCQLIKNNWLKRFFLRKSKYSFKRLDPTTIRCIKDKSDKYDSNIYDLL